MPRLTLADLRDCRTLLPGTGFRLSVPCETATEHGPVPAFQIVTRKPGTDKSGANHPTSVKIVGATAEGKESNQVIRDYQTTTANDVKDYFNGALDGIMRGGFSETTEPIAD